MALKPLSEPLCSPTHPLVYDEACLNVTNLISEPASLFRTYNNCYKCKLTFWANVEPFSSMCLIVQVHSPLRFLYTFDQDTGFKSCVQEYHFGQHGMYKYMLDLSCDGIEIVTPPDSPYTSLYLFLLVILLLWVAYIVFKKNNFRKAISATIPYKLRRHFENNGDHKDPVELYELTDTVSKMEASSKVVYDEKRESHTPVDFISRGTNTNNTSTDFDNKLLFLSKAYLPESDVLLSLRGLMITTYIFTLVEGGTYFFSRKSLWNGLKPADICTGAFYWVLAASFYIRVRNSIVNGETRKTVYLKQVLLRSLIYVIGGILYNKINETSPFRKFPRFSLRIFGVFQRIGLSSLIILTMEVLLMKVHLKKGSFFQDLIDSWPQLTVATLLAAAHTCITFLLPVPGCPTGYTGPGGLAHYGEAEYCTGGAAGYIDRTLFPHTLLKPIEFWKSKENRQTYDIKVSFDPEGLLGTLNTCFLMALAMQAIRVSIYAKNPLGRITRLLSGSLWQFFVGLLLIHFSKDEGPVPPNVYLMSLSYVLLVSGVCYFLFLLFYLLIDVCKVWSGLPFIYTGANIIVVYVGGELLQNTFPFEWGYNKEDMEYNTLCLLKATWSVGVWTLLCYYLFQKNIICPV